MYSKTVGLLSNVNNIDVLINSRVAIFAYIIKIVDRFSKTITKD